MQIRTDAPSAVLFDMDGTLVDTEHLWWQAVAEVARRLGRPLTEDDLPEVLGRPVEHTARHLLGTLGDAAPGPVDPAGLSGELEDAFAGRVAVGAPARPGALRLLEGLRAAGVPAALVSASPRRIVDLVLHSLGTQWFAVTVAAEDTPRTKPAPDPYLSAASRLGAAPGRCVAVEDSPTGVASARAAGCPVLAVPSTVPIAAGPGVTVLGSLVDVDLLLLGTL